MSKKALLWAAGCLGLALIAGPAAAKEVVVTVDARAMPWRSGPNPRLTFGLGDGRPPTIVWSLGLIAGIKLTISAEGWTTTVAGGGSFGPEGQTDWTDDRGTALFPSHYMPRSAGPVHLNQLVGCFIDADGGVVGEPFPIGRAARVEIPSGAAALALGINDDRFNDNSGSLKVTISMPDPKVIVEDGHEVR